MAAGAVLLAPLFAGLVVHGLCIRFRLLRGLTTPLDRGALWRGRRLFGDNKTWRGIACVSFGTALGFLALGTATRTGTPLAPLPAGPAALALGALAGAAAMLAELPNSALKRQLDVPPGQQARGLRWLAFHVLDQVDVLAGAWVVLAFVIRPTAALLLGSFLFVYLGHQFVTLVGYLLGMRATAR